ncbi:alpha/beta hydrolase family protein [Dyella mobilis]|uniref:Alpha/beta hydrolase n=1 Tax=Dyella mobilis TaxID=1849582 RepID=A0ABS2KGS3_9GAMM|nr:alpha/beta hydrolase [Dyella mobilis]MBM7129957.1 alpha/beta hydrolase [Dyella mobilis]
MCRTLIRFGTIGLIALGGIAHAAGSPATNCHIGAYRLSNGDLVDIGATDEAADLRWNRDDGTTGHLTPHHDGTWSSTLGWTGRPDGITVRFSDCGDGGITFNHLEGKRVPFDITNTQFQGAGVTLAGRLVLPKGNERVPIVVLVHGSEHDSALEYYDLQRMFPAMGIGVFVYDKRGTGASSGTYTQDFLLLADDAIAAVQEAKRLAGNRAGRIGYQGGSEGGWVEPLAAKIAPVDFVIVGFGLAVSPLDEDREAIEYDMQSRGYGSDVMGKAMQIADASAAILLSDFSTGYDRLDALKKQYGKEPWFKYVRGDVTWALLAWPANEVKQKGPVLFAGVPLQYDPMPVLRHLETPQLWILGKEDDDAPSAETTKRLIGLQKAGQPISVAVFPRAEHGIYEFETAPDGSRNDTRNPSGYFSMMRDYILDGKLGDHYGDATLYSAPPAMVSQSQH